MFATSMLITLTLQCQKDKEPIIIILNIKIMLQFTAPTKNHVSASNQAIFTNLEKGLGFVPNIYATLALSENALGSYLALQGAKTSLKAKEKEVVNLVVSQVNGCEYCLAAHTALGKMNGFTDEEILDIRAVEVTFDAKVKALSEITYDIAANKGHIKQANLENFYDAGYTQENLVDLVVLVGDKIVTNYLHALTKVLVDFPAAPKLDKVFA
jgi:uncharacterized peroxidase-related enzyme